MKKSRVLSGIQPSGKLHLGNLIGALESWVKLQDKVESFFEVADIHALTVSYADTSAVLQDTRDVVIDLLAVGLDPKKSTIFLQSDVPEHAELHLILSMITPLPWLERVPTYKGKMAEIPDKDLNTYGFLGYPVLQAADILIYKADKVPVGKDQLPHLELTREIARRFNYFYGETFPIPQDVLTEVPILPGIDGRKMSKSYNNTIALLDSPKEVERKVNLMITDPARVKKDDKGHPEVCTIYAYYQVFAAQEKDDIAKKCRVAEIGCVECKKKLAGYLLKYLAPVHKKRAEIVKNPKIIEEILVAGKKKAQALAQKTMAEVKKVMKLR